MGGFWARPWRPYDEATGEAIRESMDVERLARLRAQIESASARVFED